MMPISAEDIGVCVVLFGSYRLRVVGISALLAGFILAAMNSIRITGLSVSDSDPSTYIIVVMLMLLVAIVLSVKYAPDPELKKSNVAIGLSLLAIYVLAISYARGAMSFLFISYRIDALLFPIILASLIILIFGIKGLKRMKFLVIYSIFASPLLLLPTFQISSPFTAFNAYVVFDTLKAIGIPVLKSNLTIIAAIFGADIHSADMRRHRCIHSAYHVPAANSIFLFRKNNQQDQMDSIRGCTYAPA
jgi:Transmembrane exosortase (Exosortase_EpsH).